MLSDGRKIVKSAFPSLSKSKAERRRRFAVPGPMVTFGVTGPATVVLEPAVGLDVLTTVPGCRGAGRLDVLFCENPLMENAAASATQKAILAAFINRSPMLITCQS